jgi:hypothetical protein
MPDTREYTRKLNQIDASTPTLNLRLSALGKHPKANLVTLLRRQTLLALVEVKE